MLACCIGGLVAAAAAVTSGMTMGEVERQRADWSDLRVFWAVAEAGSFGAAARGLKMSQPTVTRRIEDLETRLGVRLFARSPQGVTLTDAGELVYDQALTMERSASAIERLVFNTDRRPEGRVGLAAPDGVGAFALAPALIDFQRANPKIVLAIDCGLWPDAPLNGDVDLVLTFGEPSHSDAISTPIAYFHYVLMASPDYIDLYGAPTSLAELPTHRYIHHAAQTRQARSWGPKTAAAQQMTNTTVETNSSTVSLWALKYGAGVGAAPTAVLSIEPELVMLDIPPVARLTLWLCHHREIARSARVRKVIDWLGEVFDPRAKPWYRPEFVHPSDFEKARSAGPAAKRA